MKLPADAGIEALPQKKRPGISDRGETDQRAEPRGAAGRLAISARRGRAGGKDGVRGFQHRAGDGHGAGGETASGICGRLLDADSALLTGALNGGRGGVDRTYRGRAVAIIGMVAVMTRMVMVNVMVVMMTVASRRVVSRRRPYAGREGCDRRDGRKHLRAAQVSRAQVKGSTGGEARCHVPGRHDGSGDCVCAQRQRRSDTARTPGTAQKRKR
jgi:hypothetical protein